MELVGNQRFTLTNQSFTLTSSPLTPNGVGCDASRMASHRVLSGTPSLQHLHLWPANHRLQKVSYTNDQEIMNIDGDGQIVEGVLSKDMTVRGEYLHTWRLKLSTTNTALAAFHLNNKEAKREIKVNYNNKTLPYCSEPTYLGVRLDRTLTYIGVARGGKGAMSSPNF